MMKQTVGKREIRVENVFCKYGFVGINGMGYQYMHVNKLLCDISCVLQNLTTLWILQNVFCIFTRSVTSNLFELVIEMR